MKNTDQWRMSSCTSLSLNCLPMRRLKPKTVFVELTTACRLAGRPTNRSPCFVKATTDGVVRAPSAFSMTRAVFPSMTATQELVVPKSMPTTGPVMPMSHGIVEFMMPRTIDFGVHIPRNHGTAEALCGTGYKSRWVVKQCRKHTAYWGRRKQGRMERVADNMVDCLKSQNQIFNAFGPAFAELSK